MNFLKTPVFHTILISAVFLLTACTPQTTPAAELQGVDFSPEIPEGFTYADGSRPLTFPADFGAHPDFRTEWWYYTGNLSTPDGRPFGFELTVFRVGLVPPTVDLPDESAWYGDSLYFAHFALSDIEANEFHAYERYARPGPGLAGAQGSPYRVWLEDWSIAETGKDSYRLQAAQDGFAIDLNDEAVAYPYDVLRELIVINDQVGVEDVVMFWAEGTASALDTTQIPEGREVGSAVAYSRKLESATLDFEFKDGKILDIQTGSEWNIFGQSIAGEMQGKQLDPVVSINHFWFSWAAFKPETRVYQP